MFVRHPFFLSSLTKSHLPTINDDDDDVTVLNATNVQWMENKAIIATKEYNKETPQRERRIEFKIGRNRKDPKERKQQRQDL